VERNRLVAQELAGLRLDHGGALVADHRVGDARGGHVGADGAKHSAGGDEDADSGGARPVDRGLRSRPDHEVVADQRPIEVARDDLDVAREAVRERQPDVDWTT
jgi:hypothetical protein